MASCLPRNGALNPGSGFLSESSTGLVPCSGLNPFSSSSVSGSGTHSPLGAARSAKAL